jgi:hypothetical protein
VLRADRTADTYWFLPDGSLVLSSGATTASSEACTKYLDDADFAITGRTAKLRIRATVASNATAPAINFTFGYVAFTVAGGADVISYTTSGLALSSVAINAPSASTVTAATGSDFNVPADGSYMPFVTTSGTQANNNYSVMTVELQQRWV